MMSAAQGTQICNTPKAGRPMVIYRISKGRKQYLRRIVQYRPLWHEDRNLALHLNDGQAAELLERLRLTAKPAEKTDTEPD